MAKKKRGKAAGKAAAQHKLDQKKQRDQKKQLGKKR